MNIDIKAFVSVYTGLIHLSTALNSPNLKLYSYTYPKLIGGYGNNKWGLCVKDKKYKN